MLAEAIPVATEMMPAASTAFFIFIYRRVCFRHYCGTPINQAIMISNEQLTSKDFPPNPTKTLGYEHEKQKGATEKSQMQKCDPG
jgi:hypothetical protein